MKNFIRITLAKALPAGAGPPRLAAIVLLLTLAVCVSAAGTAQDIDVPSGTPLTLKLPSSWDAVKTQPSPSQPPSLSITITNDNEINIRITFLGDKEGRLDAQDKVDQLVKAISAKFAKQSVEKEVKITKLESTNGTGSYARFTDADLVGKPATPGQFKVFAAGFMVIGKSAASFSIVANSFEQASYKEAIKFVQEGIVKRD